METRSEQNGTDVHYQFPVEGLNVSPGSPFHGGNNNNNNGTDIHYQFPVEGLNVSPGSPFHGGNNNNNNNGTDIHYQFPVEGLNGSPGSPFHGGNNNNNGTDIHYHLPVNPGLFFHGGNNNDLYYQGLSDPSTLSNGNPFPPVYGVPPPFSCHSLAGNWSRWQHRYQYLDSQGLSHPSTPLNGNGPPFSHHDFEYHPGSSLTPVQQYQHLGNESSNTTVVGVSLLP
jgi:hypothetical protein